MKAPSLMSLWPGELRTTTEQKKESKTQHPSFSRKHYALLLSVGLCLWQPIVGIARTRRNQRSRFTNGWEK
jgi:hypothetical protein